MNMLDEVKGKLIVSCQALPEEPLHSSFIMGRMALAAMQGGAAGIRAQGQDDILEIMKVVTLPVIGIVKRNYADSDIYITPTQKEVNELLVTNCQIIAIDATMRKRPGDERMEDLLALIHQNGRLAMADCSTFEECMAAEKAGFDCVSTTLFGYTDYSVNHEGPDLEALKRLVSTCQIPVIAEGKINTPKELAQVMKVGAFCAVIGGAITRPKGITERFVKVLSKT